MDNTDHTIRARMEKYFDALWPICRSITGNGLRESFSILREVIPLSLQEVPTGTQIFDWEIPNEWNIKNAYFVDKNNVHYCNFKDNNLHVVNYSVPVNKKVSYDELCNHLHYIKDMPDAIPYVTSYYKETWGFCISYNDFLKLDQQSEYHVVIDSKLDKGSLTYGELYLPGKKKDEILFSSYLCHPSMANNELSGPLVLSFLYEKIKNIKNRKYSYRFVIAPETIGTLAFLNNRSNELKQHLKAGYVLTCCGDKAAFTLKLSKHENSAADKAAIHILKHFYSDFKIIPFSVGGSDERQYCSPGFNFPVASLMRSMYQTYPQYHTSLDNKNFISFDAMLETVNVYHKIVRALELDGFYKSSVQYGEPQLGKRGLYPSSVSPNESRIALHNRMHLLSYADGSTDLFTIADKRGNVIFEYENHINALIEKGLLIE